MMYVLVNNYGGFFKRLNRYNVSECDGIGFAKTYKNRKEADFMNSQLKEDFKVIEIKEKDYVTLYNEWYETKMKYNVK